MAPPRLIRLDSVASTQEEAHRLGAQGAVHGTAVVASEQTAGRGTRGRYWSSNRGGLWLSLVLRPLTLASLETLSIRVGLALADTIETLVPEVPMISLKWPNDLVVADRKLGGVLAEARWQGEQLSWVVVGVGLNIANPIPQALESIATSLSLLTGIDGLSPDAFALPVINSVSTATRRGGRLGERELSDFAKRDILKGRAIAGMINGVSEGINSDGALLVRDQLGRLIPRFTGSVDPG